MIERKPTQIVQFGRRIITIVRKDSVVRYNMERIVDGKLFGIAVEVHDDDHKDTELRTKARQRIKMAKRAMRYDYLVANPER